MCNIFLHLRSFLIVVPRETFLFKARSLIVTTDPVSVREYSKRNAKQVLILKSQFYVVFGNFKKKSICTN
jgi:hypothetical protein